MSDPALPLLFGKVAKMFGVLPSELLKLDALEMGFNIACMEALDRQTAQTIKSMPPGSVQACALIGG